MILKATTSPQKRGRAVVLNEDGTFNREVELTAAQYAALALPGAGAPPGVTKEEWEGKWWNGQWMDTPQGPEKVMVPRASASGYDFDLGDVRVDKRGFLNLFAFTTKKANGETVETYLQFAPGEWSGTPPNVTVTLGALATLPPSKRPLSIVDGVLVDNPLREDGASI